MPATMTIYPYLLGDTCWVFDDERTGLKEEAFVLGMTEMIARVVGAKSIPNAEKRFAFTFAAEPFDHNVELAWLPPTVAAGQLHCEVQHLPEFGNWCINPRIKALTSSTPRPRTPTTPGSAYRRAGRGQN